jgi:hypothetical protein
MQGIYNYVPETHVSRIYNVASYSAYLYILFYYSLYIAHIILFPIINVLDFYITTF